MVQGRKDQSEMVEERRNKWWNSAIFNLYISYGLSCFGEQLWMSVFGLTMIEIGQLRLVAINLIVNSVAVMLFGSTVGKWIDAKPRLTAGQTLLTINNVAIAMTGLLLMAVMVSRFFGIDSSVIAGILVLIAVLTGAIATLAIQGSKIVLAKDWGVVMSGDSHDKLAERNAMLVRIDLLVSILAPLFAGHLMSWFSSSETIEDRSNSYGQQKAGCIFVIGWHICLLPVELWMIRKAYNTCPQLAVKTNGLEGTIEPTPRSPAMSFLYGEMAAKVDAHAVAARMKSRRQKRCWAFQLFSTFFDGWGVYKRQFVFPAALGLALLYLTVLGFDSVTIGFAKNQGLPAAVLGWTHAVACGIGILATITFPMLRRSIGIVRTGTIALAVEVTFLTLAILSIWLPGSPFDPIGYFEGTIENTTAIVPTATTMERSEASYASILVMMSGILLARFGLWTADLSITQIMQEGVSAEERGTVFGVQASMNFLFDLVKNLLVFALPDPKTFGILIIFSVASIFTGFLSFCVYRAKVRKMQSPEAAEEPLKSSGHS